MSTESARPSSRVRASDAEREEYASVVREAVGEGRLTLDEGDERQATIYAAKFRDELRPVVADLPREEDEQPQGRVSGGRGPWADHRRGLWAGPRRGGEPGQGGQPGHGVRGRGDRGPWAWGDPRRRFVRHVTFVAFIAVVLTTVWAAIGSHFFWPAIPLAFLAIGLIRHGMWLRWYGHRR
jgi:hypothetical protein